MRKHTQGSIISFTPDPGWVACFKSEGEEWSLPMIGWAVVARVLGGPDTVGIDDEDEMETSLQPVVLDDSCPETLSWYLRGFYGYREPRRKVDYSIVRTDTLVVA